jgi:hypothetical protein
VLKTLSTEVRKAVVQDLVKLTREKYVYPDVGMRIANQIQAKLEGGEYDSIDEAHELASVLTSDLREISDDRHWSIVYDPEETEVTIDPEKQEDEAQVSFWLELNRRNNFGFERVERLKGNIGYIDIRQFAPSEFAAETAIAAMSFVSNCDALIFDVRKAHGGYPSMVQLIISYLVDPEPKHINTFYYRPTDETQQFWTFPHVPGKRLVDTPVYVLTSNATGSGAEEFVYNLKHMERAMIIGETTLGAAHPVTLEIVQDHFKVRLPYGRPINPITKGNWEGTGIEPHIEVSKEEALKTAHILAMEELLGICEDVRRKDDLAWELDIVKSEYSPVILDLDVLQNYAGQYKSRIFSIQDGSLTYMHQDHPIAWKLIPVTETSFRLDEDLKFEFLMGEEGQPSAVVIAYADGRPEVTLNRSD